MGKELGEILAVGEMVSNFTDKSTKCKIQKALCLFYLNRLPIIKEHIAKKELFGNNIAEYLASIFSVSQEYMENILEIMLKSYNHKTLEDDFERNKCCKDKNILANIEEYTKKDF